VSGAVSSGSSSGASIAPGMAKHGNAQTLVDFD
jgi:hypothetical protein